MGHQDAGEHDIHDGGMVRDKNILFVFVLFLIGKPDEFISQSHTVKHSETPDPDEPVSMFIMLFTE